MGWVFPDGFLSLHELSLSISISPCYGPFGGATFRFILRGRFEADAPAASPSLLTDVRYGVFAE